MKNIILLILLISFISGSAFGMSEEKFNSVMNLIQTEKYDSAWTKMEELYSEDTTDAEYYVLVLNYYLLKSSSEQMIISDTIPVERDYMILEDSTGNEAGYIYSEMIYDFDSIQIGIDIFNLGLNLNPDRLDMYFGLVHIYESVDKYREVADELIRILDRASVNNQQWFWSYNKLSKEDPNRFVLENIQYRVSQLFDSNDPGIDSMIYQIGLKMNEVFPGSTYGFTNIGVQYSAQKLYDSALVYFHKAIEIDSTDVIVLLNLAEVNELIDDKEKAIEFYNKTLNYIHPDDVDYIKSKIDSLKSQ